MKRLVSYLMGLAAVVLLGAMSTSCSKEEVNEKNIVGKWQSTQVQVRTYEDDKLVSEYVQSCIDWYIGLDLKADGKGFAIEYEGDDYAYTATINWVLMGDKLMISPDGYVDMETTSFTVVSLKNDMLELSLVEEWTENGIKIKDIPTFTFKKL